MKRTFCLGSWTISLSLQGTVMTSTSFRVNSFLFSGLLRTQTVIWWSSTPSVSRIGRNSNVAWNSLQKNNFFVIQNSMPDLILLWMHLYLIMERNSQLGLPGSMFMSAFFSSFISACRARRSSRFFSNLSTSFTTFDRRRAAAPPPFKMKDMLTTLQNG